MALDTKIVYMGKMGEPEEFSKNVETEIGRNKGRIEGAVLAEKESVGKFRNFVILILVSSLAIMCFAIGLLKLVDVVRGNSIMR